MVTDDSSSDLSELADSISMTLEVPGIRTSAHSSAPHRPQVSRPRAQPRWQRMLVQGMAVLAHCLLCGPQVIGLRGFLRGRAVRPCPTRLWVWICVISREQGRVRDYHHGAGTGGQGKGHLLCSREAGQSATGVVRGHPVPVVTARTLTHSPRHRHTSAASRCSSGPTCRTSGAPT